MVFRSAALVLEILRIFLFLLGRLTVHMHMIHFGANKKGALMQNCVPRLLSELSQTDLILIPVLLTSSTGDYFHEDGRVIA